MKKVTKLWKMKDGNTIRICDMDDNHLQNTIAMLERATETAREKELDSAIRAEMFFQGEQALLSVEEAQIEISNADTEYFFPIYKYLLDEQNRRKDLEQ